MSKVPDNNVDNGLLKSLLLTQVLPNNLVQQENALDIARMIGALSQHDTKSQHNMLRAIDCYRNLIPMLKQPLNQIYPVNTNDMFNFFPQFQIPFHAPVPFMATFPLNLSATSSIPQTSFPANQIMQPKIENDHEKHLKPKNLLLKRHYNDISTNSGLVKDEMLPGTYVNIDTDAPFGRSKSGKPLKRPGFVPSYMENGGGPFFCVVCDKEASGLHYKAMTCEGCKGFFRRTIQQHLSYDCKFGGLCDVSRKVKKDVCRKCRWEKCLTTGMATGFLSEEERRMKNELIKSNKLKRTRPIQDSYKLSGSHDASQSESIKSECDSNREESTSFLSDASLAPEMREWMKNLAKVCHSQGNQNIGYLLENLPGFDRINQSSKYCLIADRGVQCLLLLTTFSRELIVSCSHSQKSADNFTTKWLNFADKIDHFTLSQSERCILLALILLVNYTHVLPVTDCLHDLETKYLNALNYAVSDSTRRGRILLYIFPEIAKLSYEFDKNDGENNRLFVAIRDQLRNALAEMTAASYEESRNDEPLPLVIKVD